MRNFINFLLAANQGGGNTYKSNNMGSSTTISPNPASSQLGFGTLNTVSKFNENQQEA